MIADLFDLGPILLTRDRTLDQRDINQIGKVFAVYQWTVNQLHLLSDRQQSLVHVQKRHVAARAAIQPHGCERRFTHSHLASELDMARILAAWTFRRRNGPSRLMPPSGTVVRICRNWCSFRLRPMAERDPW